METEDRVSSANSPEIEFRPTFEAGHRVLRVRFVMVLSLIWGIGGLWAAYASFVHMVDESGGPGAFGDRLGMALFIAIIAIVFPLGMDIYARCYVVRMESSVDRHWRRYTTLAWWGERTELIRREALGKRVHHAGKWRVRDSTGQIVTPIVNAPYQSQRIRQRRLPYILDDQGFYFDTED